MSSAQRREASDVIEAVSSGNVELETYAFELVGLRARVAELDERINAAVDQLFRVGEHNEAGRLVLECIWDGSDGGGWCRSAVRDVLRAALRGEDAP